MSAQSVICARFGADVGAVEKAATFTGRSPSRFVAWAAGNVALAMLDALENATPEQRRGRVDEIAVALHWEPSEAAA